MRVTQEELDSVIKQKFIELRRKYLTQNHQPKDKTKIYHPPGRCLYSNNSSVVQPHFPEFNAVQIPGSEYVLSEGPSATSMPRFFAATVFNQQFPVNIFVAIGPPYDNYDIKFLDYFYDEEKFNQQCLNFTKSDCKRAKDNCVGNRKELSPAEFFLETAGVEIVLEKNCQFKFYRIQVQQGKYTAPAYVIHFEKWPDHGLPKFNKADLQVMTKIAKHVPRFVTHCSAGLGRGPTFLACIMGFKASIFMNKTLDGQIAAYMAVVERMKTVKPGAVWELHQCITGFKILQKMESLYKPRQLLSKSAAGILVHNENLALNEVDERDPLSSSAPVTKF